MDWEDIELLLQPKYVFGAIGVVGVFWVFSYVAKAIQIRKKINGRQSECRAALKKLEEYLGENGISEKKQAEILKLSMMELWVKLQSGQLTAQDAVKAYQMKALEVNKRLNCLVEPVWEAEQTAMKCDLENGNEKGLLHGIPISIKENYYIQGYDSTGGMSVLLDHPAREDGVLIQVLRKQGAVPFVRTNIPQLMMTFECSNPLYGTTVNPHNVLRGPGGSSGGEGALIGSGGSLLGFGTDIGGSLRIPSNFCGICCLKPTAGRLSLKTCEELVYGQTLVKPTPGPLAKDVDGLVLAMRAVLCPYMFQLDPDVPPIQFRNEIFESQQPLRIGYYVNDGYLTSISAVEKAVHIAKTILEQKGHKLVPFQPPRVQYMFTELFIKSTFGDGAKQFFKLFENDEVDPTIKVMIGTMYLPSFLQRILSRLLTLVSRDQVPGKVMRNMLGVKSVPDWWELAEKIEHYKAEFLSAWKASKLDVLICPTFPFPACPTGACKYVVGGVTYTTLYNLLNYPAGSIPVTKVTAVDEKKMENYPTKRAHEKFIKKYYSAGSAGLPVGVQCVGLPYQEELVLRLMKEIEDGLKK